METVNEGGMEMYKEEVERQKKDMVGSSEGREEKEKVDGRKLKEKRTGV